MGRKTAVAAGVTAVAGVFAIAAVWYGLLSPHPRLAMTTFNDVYGTEDSRLDNCAVCHTHGRALNSYGQAVRRAIPLDAEPGTDDERIELLRAALRAVEAEDSDGDGSTNLVEIEGRTFPGDSGAGGGQ